MARGSGWGSSYNKSAKSRRERYELEAIGEELPF